MVEPGDRSPGIGQPGTPGRPTVETQVLSVLSGFQRHEGQPLNATKISNALMNFQDQVSARIRGLTLVARTPGEEPRIEETKIPTEEDEAELATVRRVQHAFDIVAFPLFDQTYQITLSSEVYGSAFPYSAPLPTHQGEFTLTPAEKRILTKITEAAGIEDDPNQLTYYFSSIPRMGRIVEGSTEP